MREHVSRNRALWERAILAVLLPGIAGAVNACGFFAVGTYTSHVSGNVARIGEELASGHAWLAARPLVFVLSFVAGAMASALLILHGKRAGGSPYWRPLLLECLALLVFASADGETPHRLRLDSFTLTSLLCAAMGLQNAMVTKISGARVRTTHMTGVATDIAIESARALDGWNQRRQGHKATVSTDLRKLRLHATILASFLTGAIVGPMSYLSFGHMALLLPCGLLLALAAFDAWLGLTALTLAPSAG
jgi:uncharacterized membrane protein YoaK (UPF0700 family)